MNPVNFLLVGTGGIAQSYASAFENHPDARLVSVADIRPEAAHAMAERFGGRAFITLAEALEFGPPVEAVIICTPPNSHEDLTQVALRRGKHVLCEKPFTMTTESARRMAAEAERTGLLLTMASKFRYVADVVKAKSLIASGVIGEVVLFENAFTGRVDMSKRWNSDPTVSGGGVLIDNGTHSVDIMRYFLGPLSEVHAVEGKRVQGLAVEDTVRLFVRSSAGVMGSVDLSWSLNKELDWYVTLYGSLGTIQVGWKQSRYKTQGRDWVVFGNGYDKVQAFRDQVTNFVQAIRRQEPLRINSEDAVASVGVIEAAYRSLNAATPWMGIRAPLSQTPAPFPALSFREPTHG